MQDLVIRETCDKKLVMQDHISVIVIVFIQYDVFQVQISYYNEKRGMMLYFGQFLLEFLLVTSRSIESTTLTHSASSVSSGGENQHCALPMSICQFNQACKHLILI